MDKVAIGWFDGACNPNPGHMGLGYILRMANGERYERSIYAGEGTNNVAEWMALIGLLVLAIEYDVKSLTIYGDSDLVIRQFNGKWKVKKDHLKPLLEDALALRKQFDRITCLWVPRANNKEADRLSTDALSAGLM